MSDYRLAEPSRFGNLTGLFGRFLVIVGATGIIGLLGWLWVRSTKPYLEVSGGYPRVLGQASQIRIRWSNPHGIRRLRVSVEQDGVRTIAFERNEPAHRFRLAPPAVPPGQEAIAVGKVQVPSLHPGRARLEIEVQSDDLRGQVSRLTHELPVVLEKPKVTADTEPVYFRHGGTGVVTFTVGGGWNDAGVMIGPKRFRSWPAKGNPQRRVSVFSFPADADRSIEPTIFARNEAGEEAIATFPYRMKPVKFRERSLELGDKFMNKVLNELDGGGAGEAAERFVRINSKMRRENDAALAAMCSRSSGKRLWQGKFKLLPNSKMEANFADHREYKVNGKALDSAWHMGVDVASVKQTPIPAANSGVVLHTGRLGIYGETVVVDHGLGVLSVYGHLSEIGVQTGESVKQGQMIAKSGMTGLAGGDHLHFGLMVDGVFVNPMEWIYEDWVANNLMPALAELE